MNVNTYDLVTFGGSIYANTCYNKNYPSNFILGSKHKSDFIKFIKR